MSFFHIKRILFSHITIQSCILYLLFFTKIYSFWLILKRILTYVCWNMYLWNIHHNITYSYFLILHKTPIMFFLNGYYVVFTVRLIFYSSNIYIYILHVVWLSNGEHYTFVPWCQLLVEKNWTDVSYAKSKSIISYLQLTIFVTTYLKKNFYVFFNTIPVISQYYFMKTSHAFYKLSEQS